MLSSIEHEKSFITLDPVLSRGYNGLVETYLFRILYKQFTMCLYTFNQK